MLHRIFKPSSILRQHIDSYHIMESDNPIDFLPQHRIYAYGKVVLVFHYRNPSLFQKRNEPPYVEPRTVLCGQQTSYYDLALAGKTGMIFILFKPFGAAMFFKMPMNEIKNENIALENIIGNKALEIEDSLRTAASNNKRIKTVEAFLLENLMHSGNNNKHMSSALAAINIFGGQITVKKLAEISCLSPRQFDREFSEFVGLNPKQYLRVVRFQDVLQKKKNNSYGSYTSLAFDCGYYDQPHFIHDFKTITDLAPKEFFATQNLDY
jgi:AraC-like DNA-binding protein